MTGHAAQIMLASIAYSLALVAFVASMVWHWRKDQWDVVEKLARSTFIAIQVIIWGTEVVLIVMHLFGANFGGVR